MPRLPHVSGKEAIRALEKLGFAPVRQKGSHVILRKETPGGSRGCAVPLHDELAPGTLRGILRLAGVSIEEFSAKL